MELLEKASQCWQPPGARYSASTEQFPAGPGSLGCRSQKRRSRDASVEAFLLDTMAGKLDEKQQNEKGMSFFGTQGPWYTAGWTMAVTVERVKGRRAHRLHDRHAQTVALTTTRQANHSRCGRRTSCRPWPAHSVAGSGDSPGDSTHKTAIATAIHRAPSRPVEVVSLGDMAAQQEGLSEARGKPAGPQTRLGIMKFSNDFFLVWLR